MDLLVIPHARPSASRSTVSDNNNNTLPSIKSLHLDLPNPPPHQSLPSISNLNLPFGVSPNNENNGNNGTINGGNNSLTSNYSPGYDKFSTSASRSATGSPGSPQFAGRAATPPSAITSPGSTSPGSTSPTEDKKRQYDDISDHEEEKRKWKPRKKRQCPECNLFFSNLATHKSTHLNPTSRPHICEFCNRGFARPNDLFRHVKCHWKETGSDKGQFKCPYKNHTSGDHCGHGSGIFSRCDTFKNHLKAIHFQYPNGTKKDQRSKSPGSCRMCRATFANVDDWLTNHLEKNACPYANDFKKKS